MNTLYIIGNGFDLYHGLQTKYHHFAQYIKEKNKSLYDLLLEHYGLPDIDLVHPNTDDVRLWADFEGALANFDKDVALEAFSDYMPNIASDDFRDGDRYAYQMEVKGLVDKLTTKMCAYFKHFINGVELPVLPKGVELNIVDDATFLNFNYTNTLEHYYGIPADNILHIHGKAANDEDIVLGHGIDPNEFEPKPPQKPTGMTQEEEEEWEEQMAENYDYSYENAQREALAYYRRSYKATAEIIQEQKAFFDSLGDIDNVVVLGHSISEVDQPYFKKVIASVSADTEWFVSYYSDAEKTKHIDTMTSLGVDESKLHLITMNEL